MITVERKTQPLRHSGRYKINCGAPDCVGEVLEGEDTLHAHVIDTETHVDETGSMHLQCVERWETRALEDAKIRTSQATQPIIVDEDDYVGGITGVIERLHRAVHEEIHLDIRGRPATPQRGLFIVRTLK